MFNLSSSSSDRDMERTKTITIAYADAIFLPGLRDDDDTEDSTTTSATSTTTIPTPETLSGRTVLEAIDREREVEEIFGYKPVWRTMSLTEGVKVRTLDYFYERKIFQLFNFLMTHLLAHTPDDPVPFLLDLVERCIRYRDGTGAEEGAADAESEGGSEPPLVFEDQHIQSVYMALDPLLEGSVSYSQYLVGMQTLGLTEFNVLPDDLDNQRDIPRDLFLAEAKDALVRQLDQVLGKGRLSSEDEVKKSVVDNGNASLATK